MPADDSVSTWLSLLKTGDELAAQQLWEKYYRRLVSLARGRLRAAAKREADEEDAALSAFDSFCRGAAKGQFPKLTDRHDLWQVLVMLTVRKAADHVERQHRQKRGGGAVRGESVFGDGPGFADVVGKSPTPAFVALMTEQCQSLLDALNDPVLQAIAIDKMQGYGNDEIAQRQELSLRSVERKLELIRRIWRHEDRK